MLVQALDAAKLLDVSRVSYLSSRERRPYCGPVTRYPGRVDQDRAMKVTGGKNVGELKKH